MNGFVASSPPKKEKTATSTYRSKEMRYIIHLKITYEITSDPPNLTGSKQCGLLTNQTLCSKSRLLKKREVRIYLIFEDENDYEYDISFYVF